MPIFQKRPVQIEAIRLTRAMEIDTIEGTLTASPGDWLITGVEGEQYPVKNSIFMATYDPADDAAQRYIEKMQALINALADESGAETDYDW